MRAPAPDSLKGMPRLGTGTGKGRRKEPQYRLPAEWEPHRATWLAWPHRRSDWPGRFGPIPWVYASIVRLLSQVERVRIIVRDAAMEKEVARILRKTGADL